MKSRKIVTMIFNNLLDRFFWNDLINLLIVLFFQNLFHFVKSVLYTGRDDLEDLSKTNHTRTLLEFTENRAIGL